MSDQPEANAKGSLQPLVAVVGAACGFVSLYTVIGFSFDLAAAAGAVLALTGAALGVIVLRGSPRGWVRVAGVTGLALGVAALILLVVWVLLLGRV